MFNTSQKQSNIIIEICEMCTISTSCVAEGLFYNTFNKFCLFFGGNKLLHIVYCCSGGMLVRKRHIRRYEPYNNVLTIMQFVEKKTCQNKSQNCLVSKYSHALKRLTWFHGSLQAIISDCCVIYFRQGHILLNLRGLIGKVKHMWFTQTNLKKWISTYSI